jgi:hypothetical protein
MKKKDIKDIVFNEFSNKLDKNEIIYMGFSGSFMFGINTKNSDTDIKCLIENGKNDILCTTDQNIKNSDTDIDVEVINVETFKNNLNKSSLLSVEMFFLLLNKNIETTIMKDENKINLILNEYKDFKFSMENFKNVVAKNHQGLINKQERQMEFNKIFNFIKSIKIEEKYWKFHNYIPLVQDFIIQNKFQFSQIEINKSRTLLQFHSLNINEKKGKEIQNIVLTAKYNYIIEEMKKIEDKYNNFSEVKYIDKLLSHNIRLITEIDEYEKTGKITFPLINKDYLLKIKNGEIDKNESLKIIINKIKEYSFKKNEDLCLSL